MARDSDLPHEPGVSGLGAAVPHGPVLLDTDVSSDALAGRGPAASRILPREVPRCFVAAPTRAELAWVRGRLDPAHPGTARVLAEYEAALSRVDPAKVLIPLDADWLAAGESAGRAARLLAGGGRKVATARERVESVSDAPTAVPARRAGLAVVTEDTDFEAPAHPGAARAALRQAAPGTGRIVTCHHDGCPRAARHG